ncbi:MAG: hypothetical protein R6V27_11115 [Balneolaceae bacterium]
MNKLATVFLICALLFCTSGLQETSRAQTVELMGGNVLNGAVTGTLLGVGVMGLQNSDDFAPLRIGLGAGILGGAGIAVYDIATLPQGQQFFISGLFNDGNNSSIIILLDTMYGAAGGAVLGTAVMLIQNKPIVEGLQYGGGAGVWAGFGLGLVDAFMLSERNRDFTAQKILDRSSVVEFEAGSFEVGIGEPALYQSVSKDLTYSYNPGFKLLSLSKSF